MYPHKHGAIIVYRDKIISSGFNYYVGDFSIHAEVAAISHIKKKNRNILIDKPGFSGAYEVEEALPVAYNKDWEDGETTPGICLLTLFRQKKGID